MSWPFVQSPDCRVRYARVKRGRPYHAYYYPFGYPIRLCIWEGEWDDEDFIDETDAPTCKHCIKAETLLPKEAP